MESSLAGSQATDPNLSGDEDPIVTLLATEAEQSLRKRNKVQLLGKDNTTKMGNIADEILDYVKIAQCRILSSLACYANLTYAQMKGSILTKTSPQLVVVALVATPEPEYLQTEPLVKPVTEPLKDQIPACRFSVLVVWHDRVCRWDPLYAYENTALTRNLLNYPPKPKERPFSKLHKPVWR